MEDFIVRNLLLTLNFPTRKAEFEFPEPTIYDLIRFNVLVKEEKYVSAIRVIIPQMEEPDFMSNPIGILGAVRKLIYGEQKRNVGRSMDEDVSWFFPASIDMLAHRYGQLPTELIKRMTVTQMAICAKGYEWNINIQSGNEKKNLRLLAESDEGKEELERDLEIANRDREFLKSRWKFDVSDEE